MFWTRTRLLLDNLPLACSSPNFIPTATKMDSTTLGDASLYEDLRINRHDAFNDLLAVKKLPVVVPSEIGGSLDIRPVGLQRMSKDEHDASS